MEGMYIPRVLPSRKVKNDEENERGKALEVNLEKLPLCRLPNNEWMDLICEFSPKVGGTSVKGCSMTFPVIFRSTSITRDFAGYDAGK